MDDKEILHKVPRFELAPTDDKLKADNIKLAQRMFDLWDGEVDFLIISSRRDGNPNVSWAGTFKSTEKMRAVLDEIKKRTPVKVSDK